MCMCVRLELLLEKIRGLVFLLFRLILECIYIYIYMFIYMSSPQPIFWWIVLGFKIPSTCEKGDYYVQDSRALGIGFISFTHRAVIIRRTLSMESTWNHYAWLPNAKTISQHLVSSKKFDHFHATKLLFTIF